MNNSATSESTNNADKSGEFTTDDLQKAVATAVTDANAKAKADIKALIETSLREVLPARFRKESDVSIELPIAHRSGNLSVAAKQLLNVMTGKAINDGISDSQLTTAEKNGERATKEFLGRVQTKAITTSGAGTGLELMNFGLSSVLLQRMYMSSQIASAFIAQEIEMPSNPFTFPLATTRPTFSSGIAENNAPTASDPGTGSLVLTAQKLIGMVQYSYEAGEDAVIAMLPLVTQQLADAAADALEDAIINGDTAGTQDTGTGANAALKVFDGIRKLTLAQSSLKSSWATGGVSTANISALRKALGKWGLNPKDLVLLCGANGYNDLVLLPETLTAEKAGSPGVARILSGTAPNIFGIDIIPSGRIREDLNASGVFDNTTTTKGSMLLVHKPSWIQGVKRGFLVEQYKDQRAQTNYVVASFRRAFKPMESLANTKAAAIAYSYAA